MLLIKDLLNVVRYINCYIFKIKKKVFNDFSKLRLNWIMMGNSHSSGTVKVKQYSF